MPFNNNFQIGLINNPLTDNVFNVSSKEISITPIFGNVITTENGNFITTEDGNFLITET